MINCGLVLNQFLEWLILTVNPFATNPLSSCDDGIQFTHYNKLSCGQKSKLIDHISRYVQTHVARTPINVKHIFIPSRQWILCIMRSFIFLSWCKIYLNTKSCVLRLYASSLPQPSAEQTQMCILFIRWLCIWMERKTRRRRRSSSFSRQTTDGWTDMPRSARDFR